MFYTTKLLGELMLIGTGKREDLGIYYIKTSDYA